jgi:hypothetical protein
MVAVTLPSSVLRMAEWQEVSSAIRIGLTLLPDPCQQKASEILSTSLAPGKEARGHTRYAAVEQCWGKSVPLDALALWAIASNRICLRLNTIIELSRNSNPLFSAALLQKLVALMRIIDAA